jgi:hypothetical protein
LLEIQYPIPPRGLGTNFSESDLPLAFASRFRNRYLNTTGGAEKRPGMTQLGNTISGGPDLDGLHELVESQGSAKLMASGQGRIYRHTVSAGTSGVWTTIYTSADQGSSLQSVQFNDKLIFFNGVDRPFYTTDASAFSELLPIIERGEATTNTSAGALRDSEIANWILNTDVVENDIVWYPNRRGYGLVTAVTTAEVRHTLVSQAAGTGLGGGDAFGVTGVPAAGDPYIILDNVELNIINTPFGPDNVAVAGSGTSTNEIRVSGLDFSRTDIRAGDYIYNSTIPAVTRVNSVSSNIAIVPVTGQSAGDSLVFLKSAMPIPAAGHVHYGRLYLLDARDLTKVRISGADDPEDFTTDAATLSSNTFNYGGLQPQGDTLLAMGSYQQFFVLLGRRYTYMFEGTNPVRSSAASTDFDFSPVGLFPHGGVSQRSVTTVGNDLVFISHDGVMSVTQTQDASTLNRTNLSEQIRVTLRNEIEEASEAELQIVHYPQRSWLLVKVGSSVYCYNYSALNTQQSPAYPGVAPGQENTAGGSWSLFDGDFASQSIYFVRHDNKLLCAGAGGKVYLYDEGSTDAGQVISTEFRTGWLTLEETRNSFGSVRKKEGKYIKPILEAGGPMTFRWSCEAPYAGESTDSIDISTSGGASPIGLYVIGADAIGGSPVQNAKFPFRWQGEVVQITVETSTAVSPDVLSRYTLYAVMRGRV